MTKPNSTDLKVKLLSLLEKKINKTKKCREFIQVQGWDGWPIIHHSSKIKLYHSRSRANRYVPPSACFVCDGIAFALPNSHLFDSSEGNVITNPLKPFHLILGTPKKHSWSILLSNLKILQGLEFNYFEVMEDLSFTSPPMLVICSSMMNGERRKPYGSLYISFLFIFSSSRLGLITLSSQEKRSVSWHQLSPGVLRT